MQAALVLRSLAIGAATGLRTMAGPAAAARGTRWARVLPLLALGELIVDKLPATPARTIPAGLAARAIGGALAGGAVAKAGGGSRALGVAVGVAGAIGAAYAGAAYRRAATRYVPALIAALIEDGLAIALARAVAKRS